MAAAAWRKGREAAANACKRALCGISATVNFSPQPRNDEKQSTSSSCSSFAGEPGALIAVVLVNFYTVTGHQSSSSSSAFFSRFSFASSSSSAVPMIDDHHTHIIVKASSNRCFAPPPPLVAPPPCAAAALPQLPPSLAAAACVTRCLTRDSVRVRCHLGGPLAGARLVHARLWLWCAQAVTMAMDAPKNERCE